jgi:hypothetical protein
VLLVIVELQVPIDIREIQVRENFRLKLLAKLSGTEVSNPLIDLEHEPFPTKSHDIDLESRTHTLAIHLGQARHSRYFDSPSIDEDPSIPLVDMRKVKRFLTNQFPAG